MNPASSRGGKVDGWEVEEHILGVITVQQYSLKKGVELFGAKAKAAPVKELNKVHDIGNYIPLFPPDLTKS